MVFEALDCVTKQQFVAVKGRWADPVGLSGLVCIYAPMDHNDRVGFFQHLVQFIGGWDRHNM